MRIRLGRLLAIARKEVIQLRRDVRSLAMAFVVPAVMIMVFGYVISFDVKNITLAVLDQDHSQRSRELTAAFSSSGRFRITEYLAGSDEIAPLLDRGAVRLALVIPPGFERELTQDSVRPYRPLSTAPTPIPRESRPTTQHRSSQPTPPRLSCAHRSPLRRSPPKLGCGTTKRWRAHR